MPGLVVLQVLSAIFSRHACLGHLCIRHLCVVCSNAVVLMGGFTHIVLYGYAVTDVAAKSVSFPLGSWWLSWWIPGMYPPIPKVSDIIFFRWGWAASAVT